MKKLSKREIDEHRLTSDELREYRRRSRELAPEIKERWAAQARRVHGVFAGCVVTGLFVAVLGFAMDADMVGAVGFLSAGSIGLLWLMAEVDGTKLRRAPRILVQQASDYLSEIRYADRPEPRGSQQTSAGQSNYWATGTYDPERFSRIRGSHSQYELDAMRDYGITADEWDANRPD